MRKSRFSEAQIIGILKELKAGKKAAAIRSATAGTAPASSDEGSAAESPADDLRDAATIDEQTARRIADADDLPA